MIMQDENNLQIADLILQWIDRTTRGGRPAGHWQSARETSADISATGAISPNFPQ
jgi:hypothetical protein